MSEKENDVDFGGCVGWVVENVVFMLGMFLMFAKTVDLMSAFAPSSFMGYTGVEYWYGFAVGCMVEGALIVMKFLVGRPKNVIEWVWNVILLVVPFAISALAQVFDSFMVRDVIGKQPESIQQFVAWFVPSIPTIIVLLFVGKAIFASIPPEIAGKFAVAGKLKGQGFKLKKPDWLKGKNKDTGKPKKAPEPAP